ncbi:MAG TPA: hypothetical protein VFX52_16205, partial [Nocardioidaceae bacterium]|nr:hypothetical protein [Nocardioidaceae bacterium]
EYTCDCGRIHEGELPSNIPPLPPPRWVALREELSDSWAAARRKLSDNFSSIVGAVIAFGLLYAIVIVTGADKALDDERPCVTAYLNADRYVAGSFSKEEFCDSYNRGVTVFGHR